MSGLRPGRPRRVQRRRPGDTPEEEILDAAAELFITHGFAGTSTRMIATAVGIQQSTIYHYFSTKEEILDNLLTRTVIAPAALAESLMRQPESAAVRLYAMVRYDCRQLLTGQWNLGALFNLPESNRTKFPRFDERREYLRECYRTLALETRRESSSSDSARWSPTEVDIAATLPFHFVEAAIQIRSDNPGRVERIGADDLATGIADAALRALGRTGDLTPIRTAAARVIRQIEQPD
ncbi:TetR/AcrR family transcriptional regulator [Nocardia spumae]|uniref:TetR/AcrR family transcriptional regulator n=1 Tax=Nocardia spumae TaxID=2887190 RepID=UPI001D1414CE|nr:TetR/AcrR family transcriptional regulator [Nocardia spumae]